MEKQGNCYFVKIEQFKNGECIGRSLFCEHFQSKEEAVARANQHLAEAKEIGIDETYQIIRPIDTGNLFLLGGIYYEVV